jgi:hypothetical protein
MVWSCFLGRKAWGNLRPCLTASIVCCSAVNNTSANGIWRWNWGTVHTTSMWEVWGWYDVTRGSPPG